MRGLKIESFNMSGHLGLSSIFGAILMVTSTGRYVHVCGLIFIGDHKEINDNENNNE